MTALSMPALKRICLNFTSCVFLVGCLAFATADDSTTTCRNGDRSACLEAQRQTERKVFADYGAYTEDEEQEENDADLMMHMQMRLNVDIPIEALSQAVPQQEAVEKPLTGKSLKAQQEAPKATTLSSAGAAAKSPPQRPHVDVSGTTNADKEAVQAPSAALSLLELSETSASLPVRPSSTFEAEAPDPGAFLTGSQMLIGAGIGAFLVVVGALLATALRVCSTGRKSIPEEELHTKRKTSSRHQTGSKASSKAWLLDWALGFEPEDIEDGYQLEAELKVRPKKKQPPMAVASDSGDTDEDEPEAESDSGELLEDAVFVAEQVEVANRQNEAVDAEFEYGIPPARLVDQIRRCDLR